MDGIIIIDKPGGWTSHDVVAKARNLLKTRRIGHTGTLDPFATGVLVLCINRATRLVQFLTGDEKEYLATMRLGFSTDTGDLTGKPSSEIIDSRNITAAMVNQVFRQFRGPIKQIPPMYSAKKVAGVKLYEMARRGEEIERKPAEVLIKSLELEPLNDRHPHVEPGALTKDFVFRVACSSGTYIRTLAEEIGAKLGTRAHLIALRRTRAGRCDLTRAVTIEELAGLAASNQVETALTPMSDAIDLDEFQLSGDERLATVQGRLIKREGEWLNGARAKLCDDQGRLVAIAEFAADRQAWQPRVVLEQ